MTTETQQKAGDYLYIFHQYLKDNYTDISFIDDVLKTAQACAPALTTNTPAALKSGKHSASPKSHASMDATPQNTGRSQTVTTGLKCSTAPAVSTRKGTEKSLELF